jgi:hypothetical protein
VIEVRRSKWDRTRTVQPVGPQPVGLPAGLASNPAYSRVIHDLDKLRPIVEYKMQPQTYVREVAPRIAHLLYLALGNDDAAAFACAAAHIQKFGLEPSIFRSVLEGRAPPHLDPPDASSSTAEPQFRDGVTAQLAYRAPVQLTPRLAELFEGQAQAVAVVTHNGPVPPGPHRHLSPPSPQPTLAAHSPRQQATAGLRSSHPGLFPLLAGERSYHVNRYCCVDPQRLGAAIGPQETAAALGLNGTDGPRFFQNLSQTLVSLQDRWVCQA